MRPGESGGSRFNEFARLWQNRGHEVTVICGNRNYATGKRPDGLDDRWIWHGSESGIDVWRCHVPASYHRGYVGRAWAFAGFLVTSAIACIFTRRPDVIIA